MAGFSGLLHHGARASVANGHRTQPVGTIEVSASPLSPAASRTEHAGASTVCAGTGAWVDARRCPRNGSGPGLWVRGGIASTRLSTANARLGTLT